MRAATRFIEVGGRGMTDERLCTNVLGGLVCGRPESHEIHHPRNFTKLGHPFEEAAPSTDEGEAREEPMIIPSPQADAVNRFAHAYWQWRKTGGRNDVDELQGEMVAAIRAPLEERIRELQRQAQFWENAAAAVVVEAERLREALRDTASHLNMASLVVDTALLPSPPSSTEGTKEVEG